MRREGKIRGEREGEERKGRRWEQGGKEKMRHHSLSLVAFHWYDACLAGPSALSLQKHPHCNTVGQNVVFK